MTYVVVAIGFIGGYVYYMQVGGLLQSEPPIISDTSSSIEKLEEISINFSMFENDKLIELAVTGEQPVKPGPLGLKTNIFSPIRR